MQETHRQHEQHQEQARDTERSGERLDELVAVLGEHDRPAHAVHVGHEQQPPVDLGPALPESVDIDVVRLLAEAGAVEAVAQACFRETTTIGLRHRIDAGTILPRESRTVSVDGRTVRVKTVVRPGGATAKAEADDARAGEGAGEGHAARAALRREAERLALADEASR